MTRLLHQTAVLLEMIKFQHSIFALPFALAGMLLAASGLPSLDLVIWIVLACVFARTAAMSFNRWADAEIDAKNERTAIRAIPAGQVTRPFVLWVALGSAVAFVLCAAFINTLSLLLSPVALIVLFGYSYCKRFTSFSHFVLGLALGIAPVGAWIAVRGTLDLPPVLIGLGVLLWTAGFDLIYSCQDVENDRRESLFSFPSKYGVQASILFSRMLHGCAVLSLVAAGASLSLNAWYYVGVAGVACLLIADHIVVDPADTRRINLAFFTINSWVGVAYLAGVILDLIRAGH